MLIKIKKSMLKECLRIIFINSGINYFKRACLLISKNLDILPDSEYHNNQQRKELWIFCKSKNLIISLI